MAQIPHEQLIMASPAVPIPQATAQNETRDKKRLSFYNSKSARATGAIHISCGVIAIIFDSIALSRRDHDFNYGVDKIAIGIWGGAMFITTGIIGLLSAKKKRGMILTYLVLSIICSVVAGIGMLMTISAVQRSMHASQYYYYDSRYFHREASIISLISMSIEMLTGVVASAFGCSSRICCSTSPIIHERVVYMAPPGPSQAYSGVPYAMGLPPAYAMNSPAEGGIEKQPIP